MPSYTYVCDTDGTIPVSLQVSAHLGPDQLDDCLKQCAVVVIPAGVPRKPGEAEENDCVVWCYETPFLQA